MSEAQGLEAPFPRPLSGALLASLPPTLPLPRVPLRGRHVELVPLDPARHTADLYAAGHASDAALRIRDYLAYGPWPTVEAYRQALRTQAASFDPIFMRCGRSTAIASKGRRA